MGSVGLGFRGVGILSQLGRVVRVQGAFVFCAWILSPLLSKFLCGAARVVSLGQGFCGRGKLECWDCTAGLVRPL